MKCGGCDICDSLGKNWPDYDIDSRESAILLEGDTAYQRIRKLEKALDVALDKWRDYSDSARRGYSFIAKAEDTEARHYQKARALLERRQE